MAEERNLATVRAPELTDEDATKAELQRRMEEARESITQTVTEIKDTVTNQYQAVKESVTEALDWREQFRKRPLAFSVGALSVGFITGYCIAATFKGDDSYDDDEEYDLRASGASPASSYYRGEESQQPLATARSYAAQAITGGSHGASSDYDVMSTREPSAYSPPPSNYSGLAVAGQDTAGQAEDQGPGLIERFKGTKAYDRLEEEVSALGDRFINELSKTAQSVVLPALFSKVKELFGVDLSNKEGEGRTSQRRSEDSSAANASLSGGAQSSFAGVNRGATGRDDDSTLSGRSANNSSSGGESGAGNPPATGSQSYATSENRGYGASAGAGDRRGSD